MEDKNVNEPVDERETTEDWEEFVRSEMEGILNHFLPYSVSGDIGVSYKRTVKEKTDQGVLYNQNMVDGVTIVIDFNFAEPVEKPADEE